MIFKAHRKMQFISFFISLSALCACSSNSKIKYYDYNQIIFENLSSASEVKSEADALTFSNTQKWLPAYLSLCNNKALKNYAAVFERSMSIDPPPQNTSPRARAELQHLIRLQKAITPTLKQRIEHEKINANLQIGRYTLNHLIMDDEVRFEFPFIFSSYESLLGIIMHYKKKFNRVRPNYLDASISPLLSVPLHPAYPSGHSAESHYWAAFFSEIDPDRTNEFYASAFEIAKNREYAGLHYPSDSQAGKSLGQQVFAFFMKDPKFQKEMTRFKQYYYKRGFNLPITPSTRL